MSDDVGTGAPSEGGEVLPLGSSSGLTEDALQSIAPDSDLQGDVPQDGEQSVAEESEQIADAAQAAEDKAKEDVIQQLLDEDKPSEEPKEGDEEEQPRQEGRASRTIRQLRARAQKAEQASNERNQQWQQWAGQMNQAYRKMETELARLQGAQSAWQQTGQPQQDPERVEALNALRRDMGVDQLPKQIQRNVMDLVNPLQQELQSMKQQAAARHKEEMLQQEMQQFSNTALNATQSGVFRGADVSEHPDLLEGMQVLTMAFAHGMRQPPEIAAPQLRTLILRAAQVLQQDRVRKNAETRSRNDSAAASTANMTKASAGTKGSPLPNKESLERMGHKDELSYISEMLRRQ